MDSVVSQVNARAFPSSPLLQPFFLDSQPPPYADSTGFNLENKVSPSVLLIIIILAIVFFISGLLHLLVRFLWTPSSHRNPESSDSATAFQGQLQQLFHLHDSGVDQSYIDTLPVFHYKAIIGSKTPFDCAVCLCEFEPDDKLRLLPKCSHAFHTECIDTWLLSHSTCPLCRSSLLPDHFSPATACAPIVLVLESGSDSSRDHIVPDRETNSILASESDVGSSEMGKSEEPHETVVTVKLGKYKNVDSAGESTSENKNVLDSISRRCFSMGSFEYIMDENSSLRVAIKSTPAKKQPSKKLILPLGPGYRAAMSECDCESRREFKLTGFEPFRDEKTDDQNPNGKKITESFSVSKIWQRGKKNRESSSSSSSMEHGNRRSVSEIEDMCRWENDQVDFDEENQSFAKKTLLRLMGRQNKVIHFQSSASNNV